MTSRDAEQYLNWADDLPDMHSPQHIDAQVDFLVNTAIETNDQALLYNGMQWLARAPEAKVQAAKAQLKAYFKRSFSPRDFDRALKDERYRQRKASRMPDMGPLPEIQINNRQLRDIVKDSLAALYAANDPPSIFVRSGQLVYVDRDERERPSIIDVTKDHLRGRLSRAANYIRAGENSDTATYPPDDVCRDILSMPASEWQFPPLEVVVEIPTLRADGTILDTPGYDAASRMLYIPDSNLRMAPIPEDPVSDEVDEAISLLNEAVGEFPYSDQASRANLFGLLLTPIVRPTINGTTPIALIDAPQAGTGKSLLANVVSLITTGRHAPMMPYPNSEEEMQKQIGSTLLQGRSLVCFDNVEGILKSPTLALVLTAKDYEDRILGVSKNMLVSNRATWIATGNNIRPSGDLPRRCYHIRLDAKTSKPYIGRQYKHENLEAWVIEHRGELIRALLILARRWFDLGCLQYVQNPLGSFEQWHRTIGGILQCAGINGFMSNHDQLVEQDEHDLQWEQFLYCIKMELPDPFSVNLLAYKIRAKPHAFSIPDSLSDVDLNKHRQLERALGYAFRRNRERRYGEMELFLYRHDSKSPDNTSLWQVCVGREETI